MAISRKTVLSRLLDSVSQPVYALDKKQRIVYCNQAFANGFESTPDELLGTVCSHTTRPPSFADRQSALDAICPPASVFLGESATLSVAFPYDNELSEALAQFTPFLENGSVKLVLAVVSDRDSITNEPSDRVNVRHHEEIRRLRAELRQTFDIHQLLGVSAAIRKVHRQARMAAATTENVMIVGPSGSGREHLAKAIHYAQSSPDTPLVSLACQFLDDELLRTTVDSLVHQPIAKDELPGLILTNAHSLADEAQHELIRLIENHKCRILMTITSNSEGLELSSELVDLVSTSTIVVPELASRPEDVRLLIEHFLSQLNGEPQRSGSEPKRIARFTNAAVELLMAHTWPGNHDELECVVEGAFAQSVGPEIDATDLPRYLFHAVDAAIHPPLERESIDLAATLEEIEIELIVRALRKADSNKAEAARLLGVQRNKLLRRMKQLEISAW